MSAPTELVHRSRVPRRDLLAVAVAAMLATGVSPTRAGRDPAPARPAITVVNCDDDGPGSLRNALALAANGDTIDLTQLQCGTITLTTGALAAPVDDIALQGAGAATLEINAAHASRVLLHTGTGTLSVSGLTFADGNEASTSYATGGCISSQGNALIAASVVRNCIADATFAQFPFPSARGGGIYAAGELTLLDSRVEGNVASAHDGAYDYARGGGVYAHGGFSMRGSTISGNSVFATFGPYTTSYREGGGVFARAVVSIESSTIEGNHAYFAGALFNAGGYGPNRIRNSTISGNSAPFRTGGIAIGGYDLEISNTTIAFNHAQSSGFPDGVAGAGLLVFGGETVAIRSSIIADNFSGPDEDDVCMNDLQTVTGSNNLVLAANVAMPPGTITEDPLLGPLTDNGGPTRTHALSRQSPALDVGGNPASLPFDQRGSGFDRASGAGTDIGAYELQRSETIFADGFESAGPIPRHS
jgi:hypothetical protein